MSSVGKFQFYLRVVRNYKNWWEVVRCRLSYRPLLQLQLRNGIRIHGDKDSQLLAITDEIFFDRVYLNKNLHISPGDTVVDIGGNIGVFTLFASRLGAEKIFVFEPFPANVHLIRKNIRENFLKNVSIVQSAVSDKNGTAKLYLGHHNAGHLLFDRNSVGQLENYISVPTTTLNALIKDHHMGKIDFLKLDCEGSEGAILNSSPPQVWKKIKQVAIEYHDNVSSLNHTEIEKRLVDFGFTTEVSSDEGSEFGYVYGWRE